LPIPQKYSILAESVIASLYIPSPESCSGADGNVAAVSAARAVIWLDAALLGARLGTAGPWLLAADVKLHQQ
jgi:hypothetical protein